MFAEVLGEWPTHDEFILTSCDEKYLDKYFPRFYKTFTEKWQLPIHVHVVDPSAQSLQKLEKLNISHTYCETNNSILKWPYSYVTYCQAQRFILLGHKVQGNQHVIVADVDSYALKEPSESQHQHLIKDMAFTTFNDRLMATFCHFHPSRRSEALKAAKQMTDSIQHTDMIGVDQKVIKQFFSGLPYTELKNGEWIRHKDIKTEQDRAEHLQCLVYHEKGTRGKNKTVETTWTDIGL
jgi:hypothetical protein